MSASANENTAKSVSNQEGEVGSHIKPQTQHAPGVSPDLSIRPMRTRHFALPCCTSSAQNPTDNSPSTNRAAR